jgi:predicted anti-sigma-YlaC factor YlaD
MQKLDTPSSHVDDVTLWAWQYAELDSAEAISVQEHVAACGACRQRAGQIAQLLGMMRDRHHAMQPTFAQQMHLIRGLQSAITPVASPSVWVKASARMVRWLAPAVAALAILFVLTRENSTPASNEVLTEFLADTPEAALLSATTEEQMQSAMLKLMLSFDESQPEGR